MEGDGRVGGGFGGLVGRVEEWGREVEVEECLGEMMEALDKEEGQGEVGK